jgi:hypothetical protein
MKYARLCPAATLSPQMLGVVGIHGVMGDIEREN